MRALLPQVRDGVQPACSPSVVVCSGSAGHCVPPLATPSISARWNMRKAGREPISDERKPVPPSGEVVSGERKPVPACGEVVAGEGKLVAAGGEVVSGERKPVPAGGEVVAGERKPVLAGGEVVSAERKLIPTSAEVVSGGRKFVPDFPIPFSGERKLLPDLTVPRSGRVEEQACEAWSAEFAPRLHSSPQPSLIFSAFRTCPTQWPPAAPALPTTAAS